MDLAARLLRQIEHERHAGLLGLPQHREQAPEYGRVDEARMREVDDHRLWLCDPLAHERRQDGLVVCVAFPLQGDDRGALEVRSGVDRHAANIPVVRLA